MQPAIRYAGLPEPISRILESLVYRCSPNLTYSILGALQLFGSLCSAYSFLGVCFARNEIVPQYTKNLKYSPWSRESCILYFFTNLKIEVGISFITKSPAFLNITDIMTETSKWHYKMHEIFNTKLISAILARYLFFSRKNLGGSIRKTGKLTGLICFVNQALFFLAEAIRTTVVPISILIRTTVVPTRILIRTTGMWLMICVTLLNFVLHLCIIMVNFLTLCVLLLFMLKIIYFKKCLNHIK